MTSQSTPAAVRKLRRSGLTVADIARLFGVHPRAISSLLSPDNDEDEQSHFEPFYSERATMTATLLLILALAQAGSSSKNPPAQRPNVLFIICDDLNDSVSGMGGHPQARTPHLARLMERWGLQFRILRAFLPRSTDGRGTG